MADYSISSIRRKQDNKIFNCYFRNGNVNIFEEGKIYTKVHWFIDANGEEEIALQYINLDVYNVVDSISLEPMELRMYFFVPYNISPIQQAIQAGHASLEYAVKFSDSYLFKEFVKNHKTWIILNGGTTNDNDGTLNQIEQSLRDYKHIPYATFREPDLNNALTAICFIASKPVWDYENYPEESINLIGQDNIFMRNLIKDKRLA